MYVKYCKMYWTIHVRIVRVNQYSLSVIFLYCPFDKIWIKSAEFMLLSENQYI